MERWTTLHQATQILCGATASGIASVALLQSVVMNMQISEWTFSPSSSTWLLQKKTSSQHVAPASEQSSTNMLFTKAMQKYFVMVLPGNPTIFFISDAVAQACRLLSRGVQLPQSFQEKDFWDKKDALVWLLGH
jgi:hypothetical protein